jgi:hypothetical protein
MTGRGTIGRVLATIGTAIGQTGGAVELGVEIVVKASDGIAVMLHGAGAEDVIRTTAAKTATEFSGEVTKRNARCRTGESRGRRRALMKGLGSRRVQIMLHGGFGGGDMGRSVSGRCVHKVAADIRRCRRELAKHGAHAVAAVLESIETFNGKRAEVLEGSHLAVLRCHRGEVKSSMVDSNIAGQPDDAASEVLAESGPELSENINAPNVDMRGRLQGGQGKKLAEKHIWVAVDCFATNGKFKGERAEAFDSHMQMVGRGKAVTTEIIEANDGLENSEPAFGNNWLDRELSNIFEKGQQWGHYNDGGIQ